MRIKTNDLTGQRLNWAVGKVIRARLLTVYAGEAVVATPVGLVTFEPSTDWATAGPLFERFKVDGSAGLIEGCRALVRSKFPLGVEVPDGLVP